MFYVAPCSRPSERLLDGCCAANYTTVELSTECKVQDMQGLIFKLWLFEMINDLRDDRTSHLTQIFNQNTDTFSRIFKMTFQIYNSE